MMEWFGKGQGGLWRNPPQSLLSTGPSVGPLCATLPKIGFIPPLTRGTVPLQRIEYRYKRIKPLPNQTSRPVGLA